MSNDLPWESWKLSNAGVRMLMELEGCKLESYPDEAGYGTIGYGHRLKHGDPNRITAAEALNLMTLDIADVMNCLRKLFSVEPIQTKTDAIAILVFNIGAQAFRGSHLYRSMLAHQDASLRSEWLAWHFVHGKSSPGLARRRAAEWKLYSEGVYE